jgi:hypothetical protein
MLPSGTQDACSSPVEAVRISVRRNTQLAFLRRGNKAVFHMSQIYGILKNPAIMWKSDGLAKFDRPFFTHNLSFR